MGYGNPALWAIGCGHFEYLSVAAMLYAPVLAAFIVGSLTAPAFKCALLLRLVDVLIGTSARSQYGSTGAGTSAALVCHSRPPTLSYVPPHIPRKRKEQMAVTGGVGTAAVV